MSPWMFGKWCSARSRQGFSLLEVVAVIVALAFAVPTTLLWFNDSATSQIDAVNINRASTLGSAVMEHVIADVASTASGQGFTALANRTAYLDTAGTGLRARLASTTAPYTSLGFSWDVTIGSLTDYRGTVTGNTRLDVFRLSTVTVTFPSARGGTLSLPIHYRATDPS